LAAAPAGQAAAGLAHCPGALSGTRIGGMKRQRIAVVGTGIAGLGAACLLHRRHDITGFEAADQIGGPTATVDVRLGGRQYAVDTGFIVYDERTYPNFI